MTQNRIHKKKHVGNTKRQRARCWFLTINNYNEEDIKNLMRYDKYMFQEEKGKNGTVHIQGIIYNKNPIEFNSVKEIFKRAHIERTKSVRDAVKYCCKEESRCGKTWYKGFRPPRQIKDIIKKKGALKWQKDIIEIVKKEPDDRSIYWFWSKEGKRGKTSLAKHLVLEYDAIVVGGRIQDACYLIQKRINEDDRDVNVVVFDIGRSGRDPCYETIEKVKDGLLFSAKYKSDMLCFPCPHVIILSNKEPDLSKLSKDRWCVKNVDK